MSDSPQPALVTDTVGKQLGDWVLVKPLGAGGMGELYLAARPGGGQRLELAAVKQLLPHLCWDPELVRMFLREVRIASGLHHPNIVRVLDWGTGAGGHYFVMEYVHGEDAGKVLRAFGERQPPLPLAVGVVAALADGLHYAHEYRSPDGAVVGVVHRDVSPSNVMIGFDGSVKLLDFGIARITGKTHRTQTGGFKGKIGYMSPEQCAGGEIDRRTDVFSLGVLLYELALGRRTFFGTSDFAVVAKILDGDYVHPFVVDRYFPPALAAIIDKALAPDVEQRYASAQQLADDLRAYAAECRLDLSDAVRAQWMASLFAWRPRPVVDASVLSRSRSGARTRTVLAVAAGLGLVGLGFAAGTMSGPATVPAGVDTAAERALPALAAEADASPQAPDRNDGGHPVLPETTAAPEAVASPAAAHQGSTVPGVVGDAEPDLVVEVDGDGSAGEAVADEPNAANGGAPADTSSRKAARPRPRGAVRRTVDATARPSDGLSDGPSDGLSDPSSDPSDKAQSNAESDAAADPALPANESPQAGQDLLPPSWRG